MKVFTVRTSEMIEKVYVIEAVDQQQVEDYLEGLNPPVGIIEDELISSVVKSFTVEDVEDLGGFVFEELAFEYLGEV